LKPRCVDRAANLRTAGVRRDAGACRCATTGDYRVSAKGSPVTTEITHISSPAYHRACKQARIAKMLKIAGVSVLLGGMAGPPGMLRTVQFARGETDEGLDVARPVVVEGVLVVIRHPRRGEFPAVVELQVRAARRVRLP
jgi:hypothetical protein